MVIHSLLSHSSCVTVIVVIIHLAIWSLPSPIPAFRFVFYPHVLTTGVTHFIYYVNIYLIPTNGRYLKSHNHICNIIESCVYMHLCAVKHTHAHVCNSCLYFYVNVYWSFNFCSFIFNLCFIPLIGHPWIRLKNDWISIW